MSDSLPVEFLFRIEARANNPVMLESGPQGTRLVVAAEGGQFEGPRLKGIITPGTGAEWATVRADGSMKADVRLLLETDDGAHILMFYQGIVVVENDTMKIRTAPLFETGDQRYAWLNNIQAVGIGVPKEDGIDYDVYQLL